MAESFVKLDTAVLDSLLSSADSQKEEVVKTVAFFIEGQAKQNAPVLTGFLRNSIKAEKFTEGIYRVNVWAKYGAFVELGTRKMSARPYLVPATELGIGIMLETWKAFFI